MGKTPKGMATRDDWTRISAAISQKSPLTHRLVIEFNNSEIGLAELIKEAGDMPAEMVEALATSNLLWLVRTKENKLIELRCLIEFV